ncbi:MAG: DUF72 domain-containing protein [Acidobacteriota bacterium]
MINQEVYIGTQGWNYADWFGPFYPPKTPKSDLLTLYSKIFNSVEVDSTFYAIPSENTLKGWNDKTPDDFIFSLKLLSEITHKNRLRDCHSLLREYVGRVSLLGTKLGCILIQLPPDLSPGEHPALKKFLEILPEGYHFAVEFRDSGWLTEAVVETLERVNVAFALTDSRWLPRAKLPEIVDYQRIDFSYIRWLGVRELTDFGRIQINRREEFLLWLSIFQKLQMRNQRIYAYFNNHFQGHSPGSCNEFKTLLGLKVVSPETLNPQLSLF